MNNSKRFKFRWVGIAALLLLVFFVWTTDKVTFQSERTVYTVDCRNGIWNGNRCSGKIAAGPRFRYRALKARGEVIFWVLGSQEPSAKLTACTIQDGRNWTCPESVDSLKSLTLAISRGEAVREPASPTRSFHSVSKVKWLLINFGFKFPQVFG